VGIVRVSGPLAGHITQQVCNIQPAPRQAVLCDFLQADGTPIDTGLILYFPAPRSFTGEDVLELHGHGGPVVMDMLLARILELGVRLARPGEFSERAFLNSKIDLAQAEAIADLIDSASRQAARLALHSLQGVFSQKVQHLVEQMIQLRLYVEAAIDFPEEEIDFLSEGKVGEQLTAIQQALVEVISNAHQGCLLREGMTVVLAGQPNAGKSTLLNALTERDSAIVTDIPGTTRDILREQIVIDGMPLHIIDTAGLRDSADTIELEGIHRAWTEIHRADRVLLLVDDRHGITVAEQAILERLPGDGPQLSLVRNKIDLSHQVPGIEHGPLGPEIRLSAKSGEGMPLLREHLKACMGYQNAGEGGFMARRRHLDALQRAEAILTAGGKQFLAHGAGELLAEDLRQAQQALGEITGEFTSDDLLGRIFSSFCIGK
jgi:tRNA modification GTPase